MLMPGGEIERVEAIPMWYWPRAERIIARTDIGLGDVFLYTYFTCEEDEDGAMFETAYSVGPNYARWQVIGRHVTAQEACEAHMAVRLVWWKGRAEDRLPDYRPCDPSQSFPVPPYPG